MTNNDKMREAFETWATGEGLCIAPYGVSYVDEKTHTAWITWQAAKSVPVVGEVVAYACPFHASNQFVNGTPCMLVEAVSVNGYGKERGFPLVVQPTHSISAAELERLRKDAERYAVVRDSTYCDVYMHEIYLTDDDLDAAIDAAIAAEGEKE